MAEGDVKAAIARRAGLAPQDLFAVSESSAEPQTVPSGELKAPGVHLLTTRVVRDSEGGQLPIIEVETQAPNPAAATRLVKAAVSGVDEYLDSKAAGEQVTDRRRLKVSSVGINPGRVQTRGPGMLIGLGAVIVSFLFGCAMILLVTALSRGWREAEASEHGGGLSAAGPEPPAPPAASPAAGAPAWQRPATVVQAPEQGSRPAPDEAARSQVPPGARDAEAHLPSRTGRPRRRSRMFAALTAGAATAKTVALEVGPGPAAEDKRSPDAGPGR
jgi:hypothetical protein